MDPEPPKYISINHDDYHASHDGQSRKREQFFLTTPFVPAVGGNPGREFIALYLFDPEGNFLEARIDDLGNEEIWTTFKPGSSLINE